MNILIVEDDRSFRKGLTYEIEELGHIVTEAENGKEAINLIKETKFDLVISDLIMPEVDGLEVYENLQKIKSQAKFILLSAFMDNEKAQIGKTLLKENFLEKSAEHELLLSKIKEMI